ncbi:MAG: hypothetical protein NVS9B6_00080 [Candidatus Limnocylindrales bacterium]
MLALRRPRVLLVVLAPALVLVAAARLAGPFLDPVTAMGLLALASAPAALALATRAGAVGGRRDTAGAFLLGTVVVWLVLVVTGAPGGSAALPGIQAFALAAGVAAGLPKVRDAVLAPIGWIGDAALLVLLGAGLAAAQQSAAVTLGSAFVDLGLAAGVLVLGTSVAAVAARIARRDQPSALIGSGTRDAGVAIAMSVAVGGGATMVALAYAGLLALALLAFAGVRKLRERSGEAIT